MNRRMEERLREMLKQSQRTNQDSQRHALNSVHSIRIAYAIGSRGTDKKEVQEGMLNASIDAFGSFMLTNNKLLQGVL